MVALLVGHRQSLRRHSARARPGAAQSGDLGGRYLADVINAVAERGEALEAVARAVGRMALRVGSERAQDLVGVLAPGEHLDPLRTLKSN